MGYARLKAKTKGMGLSSKEQSAEVPGWLEGLREDGEALMYGIPKS